MFVFTIPEIGRVSARENLDLQVRDSKISETPQWTRAPGLDEQRIEMIV